MPVPDAQPETESDTTMPGEFSLIDRYFAGLTPPRDDVRLGIGDDAALLAMPAGQDLVLATDTLVAGVHFPGATAPEAVGHKALAVNLSDLAAMGAEPAWATLALTLPEADAAWLAGFAAGFGALAAAHGVALVGGDTTRGALTVTVTLAGRVPSGEALTRAGARPGDGIWVTGSLGDAGMALALLEAGKPVPEALRRRLDRPEPRLAAGRALRGLATAAIDVSDGLAADLGHLLQASGVGARVAAERLPRSAALRAAQADEAEGLRLALGAGDDYELCFTLPPAAEAAMNTRMAAIGWPVTWIGEIEAEPGLRLIDADGRERPAPGGFDHFGGP